MTDADISEKSRITCQKSAGHGHSSEQDSQMLGRFAHVDWVQSAILLAVQKLQLKIQNAALVDTTNDAIKQQNTSRDLCDSSFDQGRFKQEVQRGTLIDAKRLRATINAVAKHMLI
jgi:hypothetical protein